MLCLTEREKSKEYIVIELLITTITVYKNIIEGGILRWKETICGKGEKHWGYPKWNLQGW